MRLAVRDKRHVRHLRRIRPALPVFERQAYKGGPDSGVFVQSRGRHRGPAGRPEGEVWRHQAAQARGESTCLPNAEGARCVIIEGDLGPRWPTECCDLRKH